MQIKGNVTHKDNVKLIYINLALSIALVIMVVIYFQERNYKPLVLVDSAHETYRGRMMMVEDKEAVVAQINAHIHLAYHYLYDLSEMSYWPNISSALHLWSYEGLKVVEDYQKEGFYDVLTSTPTKTEVIVEEISVTGKKTLNNLQYPDVAIDQTEKTENITFQNAMLNNVVTHLATVVTYHRIMRGNTILAEERHIEDVEIYTGFQIDAKSNPFGYKIQTLTRKVEKLNIK